MNKIIKIKIGKEDTIIWYSKKVFNTRRQAVETAISHLQRILDDGLLPNNE